MYASFHYHTGELPSWLGQLGILQSLHLGRNQLRGESPKRIIAFETMDDSETRGRDANLGVVDVLWKCVPFSCKRNTVVGTVRDVM